VTGEETLDSPRRVRPVAAPDARGGAGGLNLLPAPREGRDAPLTLTPPVELGDRPDAVGEHALGGPAPEPGAGDATAARRGAQRSSPAAWRAHLSLTLLVVSMLAFGATLVLSPFWRQQLAGLLGVSVAISPLLEAPRVPDGGIAPAANMSTPPSSDATRAGETAAESGTTGLPAGDAPQDEAAPETTPSDRGTTAEGPPASTTTPTEGAVAPPAADAAAAQDATASPAVSASASASAAEAAPGAGSGAASIPASPAPRSPAQADAAPEVTPTPAAVAKPAPRHTPAPRATARLRISVTHDLKSGRLELLIDGRTVVDQALRARRKRYLLVFQRREGTLESRLAVVPGRRRITVQVRSGSHLHAEELSETFAAGATRQLNLRVSGRGGLAFDWE
jgi:hypothetical protein